MKRHVVKAGAIAAVCLMIALAAGCGPRRGRAQETPAKRVIVTSDTILAGIISSLLPEERFTVSAIMPPNQCPGHFDVKLSDIEKMRKADLAAYFSGMPFMEKARGKPGASISFESGSRNWMVPEVYAEGVRLVASKLSAKFPEERAGVLTKEKKVLREVEKTAERLKKELAAAGVPGAPVLASSMQKEPLEWMGLRVVGEYGRPESLSAKDVVGLIKKGRQAGAAMVVDNMQSGPDMGESLAEALGAPHVVLTNFPSEKGYLFSLKENVRAVIDAHGKKK
ncbi:MAG TPA: zinc ABC transporter substrate-binding protein [bacterium]|nr:zinc ABC transporter substrate-binding protein [bacterium]